MKGPQIEKTIFWVSLIVIAGLVIPLIIAPEAGQNILGKLLNLTTGKLGWTYLWFTIGAFGILLYFALGRYSHIKFGGPDAEPDFSLPSWIAMLFCAGIGAAVMYWGTIEWAYYYTGPPFGIEPKSTQAAEWAAMYGMFHWGFTAWAVYCIPTLPLAYLLWNRKRAVLRLSAACSGLIGRKAADGWIGKIIDVLFMFGLIGGVGTSMGLGTPMLSAGIAELFSVERSFLLDVIVVIIWAIIFGASVYSGLEKGIKRLSDLNLILIVVILGFTFLFGPTVFILSSFTNSIGLLTQNFIQMSFWMDPVAKGGFPEGWTIFYWAWWIAYAPFMGLFVARISRGRTIRQVIVAEVVGGSFGCWIFFAILGNTSMYYDLNGIVPVSTILADVGAPEAIVATITALPMGALVLVVFVVLAFVFGATTLDSSAFTLASVATEEQDDAAVEPARWHRLFWAFVLAGVSLSLMYLGGLKPLQTASVVVALPLMGVLAIMVLSFKNWLAEDFGTQSKEEAEKTIVVGDSN